MVPIPAVVGRCLDALNGDRPPALPDVDASPAAKRLSQPAGTLLELPETSDLRASGAVDQSG
ncbi:hypothetical protein [Burkholderia sp. USMB20]|uniref:hypothetical protein n=1 Tax=Burkholderia sp. USMB20 TaxID=1571773 RepID=UPI001F2C6173